MYSQICRGTWGFQEPDSQKTEDNVPLAGAISPSLMVSQDPEAHSEDSWQGGKNGDLKRSSDKWTAQQDSTCAQGSLHSSHRQPGEGGYTTRHLQGAGGRRYGREGVSKSLKLCQVHTPNPLTQSPQLLRIYSKK